MSTLGDLILRVGANIDGFTDAMSDVSKQVDKIGRDVEKQLSGFEHIGERLATLGASMSAAVTLPIIALGEASVEAAGKMEQAQIAFTTLLGSGEKAKTFLEDLVNFALKTPFEIPGLVDASKKLLAFGFESQEIIPMLTKLGDAASGLGMGAEGIDRLTLAFGEMRARGSVAMKEMNQLAMSGIPALEILADKMDMSMADMMKKIKSRQVEAATAIPLLLEGINEKFGGMMDAQSKSLLGMWSNVKDSLTKTFIAIGDELLPLGKKIAGFAFDALDEVRKLAKAFGELPEPVKAFILTLTGLAAALGPVLLAIGAIGLAIGTLGPALATIAGAFGISTLALGGWAVAIGVGLAALVAFGVWVDANWEPIRTTVLAAWDGIKDIWGAAWGGIEGVITPVWDAIKSAFDTIWPPIKEFFSTAWGPIGQAYMQLWDGIKTAVLAAWGAIKDAFSQLITWAEKIPGVTKLMNLGQVWTDAKNLQEATKRQIEMQNELYGATEKTTKGTKAASAAVEEHTHKLTEAERQAISWAKAQEDMMDRYKKQAEEQVKLEQKLMEVDDQLGKSKLALALSFQKGADEMKRVAETALKIDLTGMQSQLDASFNILDTPFRGFVDKLNDGMKKVVDTFDLLPEQIRKPLEDTKRVLQELGDNMFSGTIFSEERATAQIDAIKANLEKVRAVYEAEKTYANGQLIVSDNEMEQIEQESGNRIVEIAKTTWGGVSAEMLKGLDPEKFSLAAVALEDAFKQLGIKSSESINKAAEDTHAAFNTVLDAYRAGNASLHDVDQARLKDLQAIADAQIASGQAVTESLKREIDKYSTYVKEGHKNLLTMWDDFSHKVGDIVGKGFESLAMKLVTGKGSFKEILNKMWEDIAEAAIKTFLKPVEDAISQFISGTLKSLMSGEGFGGLITQIKELGRELSKIFAPAAKKVAATATDIGLGGEQVAGGSAGDVAGAASGSIAGVVGAVGSVVSAISGVIGNFQMAHMNTALGRIEESTRKTWIVTGEQSDSMLETLHLVRNSAIDIDQRVTEISNKISDVIAMYLNDTYDLLKNEILSAIRAISGHVDDASTQQTQDTTAQTDATTGATSDATQAIVDLGNQLGGTGQTITDGLDNMATTLGDTYTNAYTDLSGTVSGIGDQISASVGAAAVQTSAALGLTREQIEAKLGEIDDKTSKQYADLKMGLIGMAAWNEKLGKWVIGEAAAKSPEDALKATQIFGGTQGSQLTDYGTPIQLGMVALPGSPLGSAIPRDFGVGGGGPGSMLFTPMDLRPPSIASLPTSLQPGGMMMGGSALGSDAARNRVGTDAERALSAASGVGTNANLVYGSPAWLEYQAKLYQEDTQRQAWSAMHPDSGYGANPGMQTDPGYIDYLKRYSPSSVRPNVTVNVKAENITSADIAEQVVQYIQDNMQASGIGNN